MNLGLFDKLEPDKLLNSDALSNTVGLVGVGRVAAEVPAVGVVAEEDPFTLLSERDCL